MSDRNLLGKKRETRENGSDDVYIVVKIYYRNMNKKIKPKKKSKKQINQRLFSET
jgi:hypothetical protein